MCLAIPSRIIEIHGLQATVDVCGARRGVNLMLLPDEVVPGDYVLVHAGFAMQKMDREAATESLQFFGALVDAGRDAELREPAGGEMSEILERGTIAWDHDSRPGT